MRNRNDAQDISIYAIHECKRKTAHRESSVTFIENFPNARRVAEQLGQTLRFCKEFGTKPAPRSSPRVTAAANSCSAAE